MSRDPKTDDPDRPDAAQPRTATTPPTEQRRLFRPEDRADEPRTTFSDWASI